MTASADGTARSRSADGTRAVTVSDGGTARLWPVSGPLLKGLLDAMARDCLGAEERQTYLDETLEEAQAGLERCQRTHGAEL